MGVWCSINIHSLDKLVVVCVLITNILWPVFYNCSLLIEDVTENGSRQWSSYLREHFYKISTLLQIFSVIRYHSINIYTCRLWIYGLVTIRPKCSDTTGLVSSRSHHFSTVLYHFLYQRVIWSQLWTSTKCISCLDHRLCLLTSSHLCILSATYICISNSCIVANDLKMLFFYFYFFFVAILDCFNKLRSNLKNIWKLLIKYQ